MNMPSAQPRRRAVELDGLRGLAITMVLVWHYAAGQLIVEPGSAGAYGLRLISFTWAGVDIFFVLSGFLIGGMLIDARGNHDAIRNLLIRRACRILPLYFLSLLLFVTVQATLGTSGPRTDGIEWLMANAMPLWSYGLFLQNKLMAVAGAHGANWIGVTWSLAVEVQAYIMLTILIGLVPTSRLPEVMILLVCAAVIFRVLLWQMFPGGGFTGFLLLPTRMDATCIGVLTAIASRERRVVDMLVSKSRSAWTAVLTSIVAVILLCASGHGIGSLGMSLAGHLLLAAAGRSTRQ